jgi:DnaJ-class molecular chaperone
VAKTSFDQARHEQGATPAARKIALAKLDDPYQTLGVTRAASQDDIRRAYRKLAKQHHPDLNPGNIKAEEQFKKVSAANELLSDPAKRARFDSGEINAGGQDQAPGSSYREYAEREQGRRYSPDGPEVSDWNTENLNDMFGSVFGSGRQRSDSPMRGRDEHYALTTDFLDAINGATRRLTLPDGRTLDVKIPVGTTEGQVLRLRGQGGAGHAGGQPGDALISISISPHGYFERSGNDIRLTLPVTLVEAILGGPIQVPTPQGPVMMQVPPHSDSGTELRLRGRGVPAHAGQSAGNLYAKLSVVIGAPDAALEAFLAKWKPETPSNPRKAMEDQQ